MSPRRAAPPPTPPARSEAGADPPREHGAIEVVPATPDRWPDVVTILGGNGDRGCWCQAPRGRAVGYGEAEPGARRSTLRAQIENDDPPPGMLAYVDGRVAGWCGFGPRPSLPRLIHSRTIPTIDDRAVWSILCFNVRVGYRRRGVAAALLDGVIELARRSGAPGLEGYPIDPGGGRVDVNFGYVGVTSMFEKAGFRRVVETSAHSDRRPRILMRLDFSTAPDGAGGQPGR
ncbi:MAG TPA: GNAT family N-acetyltransferase [Verrucomicrobiae bacterium]|jgi:GNAT superfamily N-acetyltransferase|nr:GNAT family N-acetyltransferase [Verrucomicrobiae bacterium]